MLFLISRFLPIIAVFCLLLQLFPFLSVFNFFIDFFYIFTRLCRSWVSAVPQSHTCTVFVVSLIMLRAVIIRLSPAVPFGQAVRTAVSHRMRPFAWLLGAVVPVRPATRRRRARRPFGIYKRHVGPNGSDGCSLGYSSISVEKQSTDPRETLLDCAFRFSFGLSLHCGGREWVPEYRMTI